MGEYPQPEVERAMKVQEVILRAMSGELQWYEAAEIIGVSVRTMRRWRWHYEHYGYDGLFDRRKRRPSPRRVPLESAQRILRLYREQYRGYNVAHFHDKLREEHQVTLSYEWVKKALQGAGLVKKGRKHKVHRRRRERRPLRGMMVFCDGSTHRWMPALKGQQQDLIAFLDDATSEVYDAYLVNEEGTLSVMEGLRRVFRKKGLFCSFYTDRGSHFFRTSKANGPVDRNRLSQIGRAMQQLGIEHIPSYSPEARGRIERMFRTWQGRLPLELDAEGITTIEEANRYIRSRFMRWHNRKLKVRPAQTGSAFLPLGEVDLDAVLCIQHERIVQADNTVSVHSIRLQIPPSKLRISFAKCRVRVCEHINGTLSVRFGPHRLARYRADGTQIVQRPKVRKAA